MLIAWLIQERVNAHDRLAKQIFEILNYRKLYLTTGAPFFGDNSADLTRGFKTFQIRVVSSLKDKFTHSQMRKVLKEFTRNPAGVQSELMETREEVKEIARQVAKSYAAMLRTPDADIPSRRRQRR